MGRVKRRQFLIASGAFLIVPLTAKAQARPVRIGVLAARARSRTNFLLPILRRLFELGYVEGKNLVIEFRSSEGVVARFPSLAAELLKANCDLIFAIGPVQAAQALIENKAAVPIVIAAIDYDPVRAGIVSNLRRPGGSVTGVSFGAPALAAKRLEILRDALPNVSKVLVLGDPYTQEQVEAIRRAAEGMRIELVTETFDKRPYDYAAAIAKGRAAGATAINLPSSPVFSDELAKIAAAALQHRLPMVANTNYLNTTGFLVGYGGSGSNRLVTRAADIAAQVLGGKKPGDIPLEEPTEFEMVINLKTAKQLGLKIPQAVEIRADRVIE